ncbi:immunoglobulin-like domain-containing protein [Yeosuana sp.]|uniref:immunoglobulin-like domain-containing protein n=1 Tax=Yeosuana sp. TaxID=2529388 RepID=UPI004054D1BB
MKQLLKKIKQISILLLVISLIGCENDDDNSPKIISGFTYTISADTGTVTFINTSVNSKNYFWTFGDGTSSTEINPIKTYTTGEYTVTLKATNVAGASDTSEDIIVISDAGAPVITLLGDTTINIMVGETFTDPGATATDDVDGDITANIVIAGDTVDENTAGTYIITYNVSDAAGNAATQRTRTVIVAEVALTCPETLLVLPIDFDCDGIDYESKRVAGDIGFSIIDNPELSGANAVASKVGEIVNIGNNWENLNFTLDTPIDFSTNKSIKLKLYSTVSVAIKLKVENGGTPVENDQTHGGTGWEELTFTLTTSESFSNIIVFIDGPGNTTGTFYIDDIEQVAAAPSPTGDYIYATSGTVTVPSTIANWDSGTTIVSDYSGDATYNPSIQLTSGTGWGGPAAAVAFTEMEVGILSNYSTLEFKIKTTDFTTIKVKVPEVEVEFPIADGTALTGGWIQMSIPLSNFSGVVDAANQFAILQQAAGTMYITDVMLSGDGNVTPPSDCPAPPAGDFISDGDFEANTGCWQLVDNGGTVTISTTISNGGSNSGQIKTVTFKNPALKQERFGIGVIQPNTAYVVKFDIQANANDLPADGAVFQAFAFSETAEGSGLPAAQHILVQGDATFPTTWQTRTYTFTTAANVDGGLSLLLELVCGGAGTCTGTVNIDNVSLKLAP